jgi:hypothetical protein
MQPDDLLLQVAMQLQSQANLSTLAQITELEHQTLQRVLDALEDRL